MAAMEEGNGDSMSTDSGQAVGLQYTSQKNFEIEKKIGKGQFSVVYKARCLLDNSIVALKKIQVSLKFDWWYWETELMLSPRIILNNGFSSRWGDFWASYAQVIGLLCLATEEFDSVQENFAIIACEVSLVVACIGCHLSESKFCCVLM